MSMSKQKKKINLSDLPKHFTADDAELFDDVFDDIGEMPMSDKSLDRILSSTMRKAGFEMKEITMNGTGIINSEKYRDGSIKDNEEIGEPTPVTKVRRTGIIAACFALVIAAAGALIFFNGSRIEIEPEPDGFKPGAAVTETDSESDPGEANSMSEDEAVSSILNSERTEIPDVKGMTLAEAADKLTEAGFVSVFRHIYSGNVPAGCVERTYPFEGSLAEAGSEVTVYVSLGESENPSDEAETASMKLQNERLVRLNELGTKLKNKFADEIERFRNEYGFTPSLYSEETEGFDAVVEMLDRLIDMSHEEFYEHLVQANKEHIEKGDRLKEQEKAAETERGGSENDRAEISEMPFKIDVPEDLKGIYVFDVYRDGAIAYTKTVDFGDFKSGSVQIDLTGRGTESLVVYIKRLDIDADNYIHYGDYEADYTEKTVKLVSDKLNTDEFIKLDKIS